MARSRVYLRAGWLVSSVINPLLMRFGFVPTLAVRGRKSGRWRTVPVNVLELDGRRYLVAPRGETDWVRNVRAAGVGEIRRGGRAEPFRAVELPVGERQRIIDAYLARWAGQVRSQFEALPDPADHPVFRLAPG